MMSRRFLMTLLLTIGALRANAGILIEPYAGGGTTTIASTVKASALGTSSNQDSNDKMEGLIYGARVGYHMFGPLWFALDGSAGSGDYKYDNSNYRSAINAGKNATYKRTAGGVTVGADLYLFRLWAGYNVLDSFVVTNDQTSTKNTYSGNSIKVGVGFHPIPLLSLNVEYYSRTYNKATGDTYQNGAVLTDVYTGNMTASGALVTVSLPLNL